MNKVKIELENCYGIQKFNQEFEFEKNEENGYSSTPYIIYASNGTMKTSFAETMKDILNGRETIDRVYTHRKTIRKVLVDGTDINAEDILVIDSYIEDYEAEGTNILISNIDLKKKYDELYKNIDKKTKDFVKILKNKLGIKETEIQEATKQLFSPNEKYFINCLDDINNNVKLEIVKGLEKIKYSEIFNKDTAKVLENEEFKEMINEYIEKYDQIISKSFLFSEAKGKFNHSSAQELADELLSSGFYDAKHMIKLFGTEPMLSGEQFNLIINEEVKNIVSDEKLKERFDKIEKILNTKGLKAFKNYLRNNQNVLLYLNNQENFKRILIINSIADNKNVFEELINTYNIYKNEIKQIVEKAKEEKTYWHEIVKIFNDRFFVPYKVEIKDIEDVILKENTPNFYRIFNDGRVNYDGDDNKLGGDIEVEKDKLIKILSTGEKKAYYILNVIFEIEKRKKIDKDTLIIIDDLADSFDYKNKYAIIQYIKEICELPIFNVIILSHNFDFCRTLGNRMGAREQCYIAYRENDGIHLEKKAYLNNIFTFWKSEIYNNNAIFIASIPFFRNLVEYTVDNKDKNYLDLTAILHFMNNTQNKFTKKTEEFEVNDIINIFDNIIKLDINKFTQDKSLKIVNLIFQTADLIVTDNTKSKVDIENKIVLSIAIRLKLEKYIYGLIGYNDIHRNQTAVLKEQISIHPIHKNKIELIKLLDEVLIMTSENIHLNAFMYEPIIDISFEHLHKLYNDIKKLSDI